MTKDELIPLTKAMEILNVSRVTLNIWHKKGIGPRKKQIGGRMFYSLKEVQDYASGEWIH